MVSLVYYDLETSGRYPDRDEVLQIAAVAGTATFNTYVRPLFGIHSGASHVNGLTRDREGNLYKRGKLVEAVFLQEALKNFIDFLDGLGNNGCLLIAHNGEKFDERFLRKALAEENLLQRFRSSCIGFDDTLRILRNMFGNRRSLKLGDLAEDLQESYELHDALGDAKVLQAISKHLGIEDQFVAHRL